MWVSGLAGTNGCVYTSHVEGDGFSSSLHSRYLKKKAALLKCVLLSEVCCHSEPNTLPSGTLVRSRSSAEVGQVVFFCELFCNVGHPSIVDMVRSKKVTIFLSSELVV